MNAPLMLGVSGCRGIVGASLTPTVAAEFAGSFGGWLVERVGGGRPRVVLAADGRAGYRAVHAAALAGLLAAGCDVTDLGVAMTPTAGVMVDHLGAAAGVVLTASHNPQQWNGLKFLLADAGKGAASGRTATASAGQAREDDGRGSIVATAAAPDAATAEQIIRRYKEGGATRLASWDRVGTCTSDETSAGVHVGLVLRALDALGEGSATGGRRLTDRIREAGFTVVLDSVNGAGAHGGRVLLERLGCRVIALGDEATGRFWHTPEPTRENLAPVMQRVAEAGAHVGFCQDPDADRLALLSCDGSYIGEEYTLVLCAQMVFAALRGGTPASLSTPLSTPGLQSAPDATRLSAAVNLSTSRMIDDVAAAYAGVVARTAVGEANVVAAMKRDGCPIGGEGNGGVIWPAVTYVRDSLGAMGLVLALMATTGKSLSDLARQIPAYAIEKRKVDIPSKDAARPAVEAVSRAFAARKDARGGSPRIDLQDGVRVDLTLPDGPGWVHVRASNTEPIMRLIAEARSASSAGALLDETARIIGG